MFMVSDMHNWKQEQPIPVITVGDNLAWDLSEYERTKPRPDKDLLVEIAEAAIRLAERAGADPEDVETLGMLLESAR